MPKTLTGDRNNTAAKIKGWRRVEHTDVKEWKIMEGKIKTDSETQTPDREEKASERLLQQETVWSCMCVYPECSRLEDNTTLSRCSAPQLRRNESFSFSLDSADTYRATDISWSAQWKWDYLGYLISGTFRALCRHLVACKHLFDENSFSLMEALVNGSVLRPGGKASRIFKVSVFYSQHCKSFNSSFDSLIAWNKHRSTTVARINFPSDGSSPLLHVCYL